MIETDLEKRLAALWKRETDRDELIRRVFDESLIEISTARSHPGAGNGLLPEDAQYIARDPRSQVPFLVIDHGRLNLLDLAASIRQQLAGHISGLEALI